MSWSRAELAGRTRAYASIIGRALAADHAEGARRRCARVGVEEHDACPHPWLAEGAWAAEVGRTFQQPVEEGFAALSSS